MLKLITAVLVAMAALFTFSVFTVMAVVAGMRIERRVEQRRQHARIARMVAEARKAAKPPYKVERPVPDAATRKAANA